MNVRTARDGTSRAELLREAQIFVPALAGLNRVRLEAAAAGCAVASPAGTETQPELAGAETARLAEDDAYRRRRADEARADASTQSFGEVARQLDELYGSLTRRRHAPGDDADPLSDRGVRKTLNHGKRLHR